MANTCIYRNYRDGMTLNIEISVCQYRLRLRAYDLLLEPHYLQTFKLVIIIWKSKDNKCK